MWEQLADAFRRLWSRAQRTREQAVEARERARFWDQVGEGRREAEDQSQPPAKDGACQ